MLVRMKSPADEKGTWFLFAHGAGAPSSSDWMKHYTVMLRRIAPTVTFDYPYIAAGRKRPDPAARLLEAHAEALSQGKKQHGPRAVLIGKSMGGRMGCHLALKEDVLGVVCLGYPLKGMGASTKLRDQVLLDLTKKACFIQGTRDPLCPLDLLRTVLDKRKAESTLHIVATGDHSLLPTKTHLKVSGLTETEIEAETMNVIRTFIEGL